MHKKEYKSYREYLDDQIDGRHDPVKVKRCDPLRSKRIQAFGDMFQSLNMPRASSCLCIGARFGEEVEAGRACFSECIGIDLLPYPPLVIEGDMHDLRFGDESFDVVYINTLDHAYDMEKVFDEIGRTLKPKGLLVVDAEFTRRSKPKLKHYASVDLEDPQEIVDFCGLKMLRHEKIENETMILFGLQDRLVFQKLTTVNYFDLGPHEGYEIADFLEISSSISDVDVHVHGIEADPKFAEHCRKRFASDSRVQIHNFAIGLEDGQADLFLSPVSGGQGSSIYADKPNVTHKPIQVPQHRMSTWLRGAGVLPKPTQTINIIKANIEGAEWDLMRDLDQEQLFGFFDLFCGAKHNWGLMTDMRKIPSLQPYVEAGWEILEKHGVQVYKYIVTRKVCRKRRSAAVARFKRRTFIKNVIDMRNAITELLRGEKPSGKLLEKNS